LSELLEKIDERIEIFREIEFSNPDILEQTSLQHLRILDAVESGDAVGAVKAIEDNISTAMQNVEHNMKEILARAFAPKGKGSA
jgi:DNA-binding GntR family transcriptional regulator